MRLTLTEWSRAAGMDARTLKKRLANTEPGGDGKFTLKALLAACEQYGAGTSERLDLAQERAALAREQRAKLERERREAEGEIAGSIRLEDCHRAAKWMGQGLAVASCQFLYGAAPELARAKDPETVCELGREALWQALGATFEAYCANLPAPFRKGWMDGLAQHTTMSPDELEKHFAALIAESRACSKNLRT